MLQLSLTSLLLFVAMTIGVSASNSTTPAVEVVGNKFYFTNNGTQFLMRGIAYQQNTANGSDTSFVDPLADKTSCLRDIAYFTKLNTNVLRVYAVNTSLDHDDCMNALSDAGIYVIADLSEPDLSINRDSPEWNLQLYNRYTDVVDMFAKYNNVLGFFAGNEVTNNASNTDASAFVKAAVRDVKAYISQKNYRTIPVGYSSNDDADTRIAIADYFSCGSLDERADFFGINMYEWCGDSSFTTSGYSDRTKEYSNLTIPVFFSEYGCNADLPRKFTEVGTIFSSEMTDVWSGGIVYMYFEEANNYGLVSIDGSSVSTMADFKYYSSEINNISPTYALLASASSAESTQTLACPASASTWKASSTLPPTPDQSICDCVSNSLTCVIDDGVSSKDYGDLYSYICDKIDCSAITASGSNGTYGGVSFCSDKEKLSYVLNEYYNANGKSSSACDFSGSASINKSASVASSCSSKVSQATKAVSGGSTVNNSGDSSSSSGSSSSSSGGSSSSSSVPKKSGASQKQISTGQLLAVGIVVTSFVGGLSMVMLE